MSRRKKRKKFSKKKPSDLDWNDVDEYVRVFHFDCLKKIEKRNYFYLFEMNLFINLKKNIWLQWKNWRCTAFIRRFHSSLWLISSLSSSLRRRALMLLCAAAAAADAADTTCTIITFDTLWWWRWEDKDLVVWRCSSS